MHKEAQGHGSGPHHLHTGTTLPTYNHMQQFQQYNRAVLLMVSRLQGEETRQQMNAELYLECSAKYQENVEEIFREATKRTLAFIRKQKNHKKKKRCVIL